MQGNRAMTSRSKSLGRVFCVTGVHAPPPVMQPMESPINRKLSATGSLSSQSETDSNTSGYISSSSMEISSEEKRLVPNEDKVYRVWDQWSMHRDVMPGPKSSTPKQETVTMKRRSNVTYQSQSLLAIKKTFNHSSKSKPNMKDAVKASCESDDSFWGIQTPVVQKSCSEGDIRATNVGNSMKGKQVKSHDAGLDIQTTKSKATQREMNHRTDTHKQTLRDDLRMSSAQTTRVPYISQPGAAKCRPAEPEMVEDRRTLANKLSRSCADLVGEVVDESISDFLSNVDTNNLAGFLDFYDKVTSGAAYERARRNTKNYEPVYY
ncbi:hypothetical protein DPMN_033928 [Dreissena polymorpha]|uniref:Uncharacterized protein n=1 Tax=Dreissena polymorpha TaxID=45954 RepID=A0A9D4RLG0_DREPO|nr:hypothetical protein DPMN_033928 [Dreissena polymorpha]